MCMCVAMWLVLRMRKTVRKNERQENVCNMVQGYFQASWTVQLNLLEHTSSYHSMAYGIAYSFYFHQRFDDFLSLYFVPLFVLSFSVVFFSSSFSLTNLLWFSSASSFPCVAFVNLRNFFLAFFARYFLFFSLVGVFSFRYWLDVFTSES